MPKQPYTMTLPPSSLEPDPKGLSMLDASEMQIYDEIIMAAMQGRDSSEAIRRLAAVPVEERYTSRVIAALGFAFGDFDSVCIRLDLDTLPDAEIDRMAALLETTSAQFCILMREFFGPTQMRRIMSENIERAAATEDDSGIELN